MTERTKRVLGISGSPKTSGISASGFLCQEALDGAAELGCETKMVRLVDFNIFECDGCGDCMNRTPCHLFREPDDQYIQIFKWVKWADAFVFASPVYAFGLPSTWKRWLDRCEPVNSSKMDYEHYNAEVAADVKGREFMGKVAAQIVTSGGIGQEYALAQLMPLWTDVKLSVVASVGLSLIEFDEQPGIKESPWGRGVEEAEFARTIARSVGRRLASTIGFSTFNLRGVSPKIDRDDRERIAQQLAFLEATPQLAAQGWDPASSQVLVYSGSNNRDRAIARVRDLQRLGSSLPVVLCAGVERLPPFVDRDNVANNIAAAAPEGRAVIDWNEALGEALGMSANIEPVCLLLDVDGVLAVSYPGTQTVAEISRDLIERANEMGVPVS